MAVVKLHRKTKTDLHGMINIMYFGGGEKKQKSLGFKMSLIDFNKHFVEGLNQFTPSPNFDFKVINKLINKNIDLDVFTTQTDAPVSIELPKLLEYFDSKIKLQNNQNSIANYKTIRNKLSSYLKTLNREDLDFSELNSDFLINFKDFVNKGVEGSTVLRYFTILIAVLTSANEDNLHSINLFKFKKKLNIKKVKHTKPLLNISDIRKLLACISTYSNFRFVNISLLQLFCNGMRQSDVFLLRYSCFLENSILYVSLKNKKELEIPLSSEITNILFNLFNLELPSYSPLPNIANFQKVQVEQLKLKTLKTHLSKQDSNNLIFSDLFNDNSLDDYDGRVDMTKKQYRNINYLTKKYNKILKEIQKDLKLEIVNLTSHSFRHSFTNLLLESGSNVYDVSNLLGHESITMTQNYITKHFSTNRKIDSANRITKLINKK